MKEVTVIFKDSTYNYKTEVNEIYNESEIVDYFVGEWFNRGEFPNKDYQQCIDVKITTNGKL